MISGGSCVRHSNGPDLILVEKEFLKTKGDTPFSRPFACETDCRPNLGKLLVCNRSL